jgi:hypothetical protein
VLRAPHERHDHEVHAAGEEAIPLEGGIAQDIVRIEADEFRQGSDRGPSRARHCQQRGAGQREHKIEEEGTGERLPKLCFSWGLSPVAIGPSISKDIETYPVDILTLSIKPLHTTSK